MFAVIKTGGKQYTVSPEDVIKVEKLEGEAGDTVVFDSVLLVGGEGDAQVGAPLVDGATVAAEIVDQGRGRKIIIFKKRRRQNSRRRNGHRQHFTSVKITEILTGGKAPAKAAKKAAPAKAEKKEEKAPAKAKAKKADAEVAALFDAPAGDKDDLKKISGVGPVLEGKLNALGITTFAQVAAFSAEDIAKVDDALNFKGRIERDNWLEQAAALAAEK
ncbi:50S ribosomal protein L21 [Cohaesibacter gelatinilyticus]|uniref:Large ribosomal subunit protein bL21 n=1 Tax=Cohaesibacter gelatinilyticus TaxID=372072 RepID=A0A285PEQ1_9HYPH|nr:50S ribosomal protein L21 [Cohaesibacter gelatinilyticus]SNZ19697.1 LSU ribosomal protein L21P [Cohaesibacter gelatinilyticus]HAT86890.1 50S ribosomal protein L21 [Hyphomicrobiales bacterium]